MTASSDLTALDALATLLRRHGYTVVPNGGEIELRIAFLIRIRVSVRDSALNCRTYFGFVERTRAAVLTTTVAMLVTMFVLHSSGITPITLSIGFIGLMAGVYECLRFIASEGALAQIHQRWSEVIGASVRGELPAGEQWMSDVAAARDAVNIRR